MLILNIKDSLSSQKLVILFKSNGLWKICLIFKKGEISSKSQIILFIIPENPTVEVSSSHHKNLDFFPELRSWMCAHLFFFVLPKADRIRPLVLELQKILHLNKNQKF